MPMPLKVHRWTRADLARLPDDGNRYEVLDGQLLVTPQARPPHQGIGVQLILALTPYLTEHRLGVALGPAVVIFGKNELQPDVAVLPIQRSELPEEWDAVPRPILVIEVTSMSTKRRDLGIKREAYQKLGIPNYWVVDRFARRALCWTREADEPTIVTDTLVWRPRAEIDPLAIPLGDILARESDT